MSSTMSLESGRVMSSSCKAKVCLYCVGCWVRATRNTWPASTVCGAGHNAKGVCECKATTEQAESVGHNGQRARECTAHNTKGSWNAGLALRGVPSDMTLQSSQHT